jgi:streptomycin 6-kinase
MLEYLETAAAADESAPRIVNQDLHYGNVLEGAREPWLVIDPKPLAGQPEFGVAPLLWTRFDDLRSPEDLERRLAILIDTAELNPRSARAWSVVRVVDCWLSAAQHESTEDLAKWRTLLGWLAPQFAS